MADLSPTTATARSLPSSSMPPCPKCGAPCRAVSTQNLVTRRACKGWRDRVGCNHAFWETSPSRTDWEQILDDQTALETLRD